MLPPLNLNTSNSPKKKEKKTSTPPSLPSVVVATLFLISDPIYSCWLATTAAVPQILDLHLLLFTLTHELNRLRYGESKKFLSSLKFIFVFFFLYSIALPLPSELFRGWCELTVVCVVFDYL